MFGVASADPGADLAEAVTHAERVVRANADLYDAAIEHLARQNAEVALRRAEHEARRAAARPRSAEEILADKTPEERAELLDLWGRL